MNKKIIISRICACLLMLSVVSSSVMAAEGGPWSWRARIIQVSPDDSSGEVTGIAGSGVSVDSDTTLEVDFTYMISANFGLELILATTKHAISGTGTLASLGQIASVGVLPPTLTAQYHFSPSKKVRPYVGLGLNYTLFYDESTSGALALESIELDSSVGLAAQAGVDFDISKSWYANVDLKYIQIDTTATVSNVGSVDVDINPLVLGVGVGMKF
ncbi:MAG: OmpW family protein [Thiohalomonadales bacterium]